MGSTESAYKIAKEQYAAFGVDTDLAVERLKDVAISLHCWQGDDVAGLETAEAGVSGGGIQATGNYPGAARDGDELRADMAKALSLIPGTHRANIHAMYAETGSTRVERNELTAEHFSRWTDWAKDLGIGIDFNGTFFGHPKADDGLTLSHADAGIRSFWIEHGIACRRIGAAIGEALGKACITNLWIPDGYKDTPADRRGPRARLRDALDEIFAEAIDPAVHLDAVESKLFGIGSESYVVGSHEFYMGYAQETGKLLTLDTGHFHPTESIADKISSVLLFIDEILLHVSRGVRWDSDHVVTFSDELRALAEEVTDADHLERTHIGLDFFDASINRIAAWVIGTRSTIKALLAAMLRPVAMLRECEAAGDFAGRLGLMEEAKTFPLGAVWDHYCQQMDVPAGAAWLEEARAYERDVLSKRG